MRVAIPFWQGRVSPVLDAAGRCLLVDLERGLEIGRRDVVLAGNSPLQRAREFSRMGIDVLICGALSRPMAMALHASNIRVCPNTCGEVNEVLAALVDGHLDRSDFLMPGCCGRRRRFQAGRRRGGPSWQNGQKGGDNNAPR